MNRVEIKKEAKEFAFENKWNIWKVILIFMAIPFAVGLVTGFLGLGSKTIIQGANSIKIVYNPIGQTISSIVSILLIPLSVGLDFYMLKLVRGKKTDIKDIFAKYKYFLPIIVITFLVGLFTSLWSLLFIIPGIIYALKVAMVNFLMADELDEDTSYLELIDKSKKMMDGHKWEYFVFNLSFIGWFLLCGITFGIASIWVIPYYTTAKIMYYEKLKKLNK